MRTGGEVRIFSERQNAVVNGVVEKCEWRDGIFYLVDAGGETILTRDEQLTPAGSALDWELWQPSTDNRLELQFIR